MAKVSLKNVRKVYGSDTVVVKDINLDIRDGEFMVLVGPSGCGKSTTLRMVAGLEDITSGTVEIGDRVVNKIEPRDRNIAMVFQNYALYPHMTVADNMTFSLRIKKAAKELIHGRLSEVSDILGLSQYLERKPKALSGGQRQRVAMGRALVREPQVFLFDEPLSNLDAKMRVEMRREIIRLHHQVKATMIYVTHDQIEAMTLGDRICIMKDGIIQQVGTPVEVFDNPRNLFVAGFIGTPPMNLIRGALKKDGDSIIFIAENLQATLPAELVHIVKDRVNREIVLGIRPKAFFDTPEEGEDTSWEAIPEITEMLGDESLVHMSAGENRFVVSMAPQNSPALGQPCKIYPMMIRGHFFDPDTGENLTLNVDIPGRSSERRIHKRRS